MMDDADLLDQAALVVEGRVSAVDSPPVTGRPVTDYTVEVERVVAGSAPGSTLVVRLPGGIRPDGVGFRAYGAPRFVPGERALLFLAPRRDGTFGVLHLGLGAFHHREVPGAPALAVRDLSDSHEVVPPGSEPDPRRHAARDFDAFAAWLADRAQGIDRPADYFVSEVPPGTGRLTGKFTLFVQDGLNLRWFEFDSGGSVEWRAHQGGQPGIGGGGFAEFRQALQTWTAEPGTPVVLRYGGQTGARGGLEDFDQQNVLLQDDPNDEIAGTFRCSSGGTLAIGGPWFSRNQTGFFAGKEYIRIARGDIVMNDGIECLANRTSCFPTDIAEVYAHELGHTLGLGHSCGDSGSPSCNNPALNDALMRASAHGACRGPRLASDDVAGLRTLYGGPGTPRGPNAPANLTGELESDFARLRWADRSDDEVGFRVYRSDDGAPRAPIADVGPDVTRFFDDSIAPGTTYVYSVAAFDDNREGARSNEVEIDVPAATPVSVGLTSQEAGEVQVGEAVEFQARFLGPAGIAEWDFGGGAVGFNDTRCAPETFCRSHVFTTPGPHTVEVTVTGDFGQVAQDTLEVQVTDAPFDTVAAESLIQSTIFAPRGDTGTFESNVWLHNGGPSPALVELSYVPRGRQEPPEPRTLTIDPAESVFLPNVLDKVFGATGQGSLALRAEHQDDGESGPPQVFALGRSFVEMDNRAEGSFGQLVPQQGRAEWSTAPKGVTGILHGDGFLSTLLAVNVDEHPGSVDVELFDRDGTPVGEAATFGLGPGIMRFRPTADLFPAIEDHEGPFTARFRSDGIRFLASSTLLEVGTEDQMFLPAREPVEGGGPVIVPRVVRSPGQFGVFLTTQLSVLNEASGPAELTFQYLPRGQNNSAPLEATRTVPAGGVLFVEDVIQDLFDLETGTGALRILWSNDDGLAPRAVALTSSESPRGGRFGMLIDGRPADDAVVGSGVAFGAEQSDLFRSQYGAVNLSAESTRLGLTLRDANGDELGRTTIGLKPRQHLELNLVALFGTRAAAGQNWSVTTEVQSGGPVFHYLANINTSGDVFFAPGRARLSSLEVPGE
ncbi:MAG: PKD domain-containing protein [Thermoanaerobaculia bacterium]